MNRSTNNTCLIFYISLLHLFAHYGCYHQLPNKEAPTRVEDLGVYRVNDPECEAILSISNFVINEVDASFTKKDKQLFRIIHMVKIPNKIQSDIGARQVFRSTIREDNINFSQADYVICGFYDFFMDLTEGEAHVQANLRIVIFRSEGKVKIHDNIYREYHHDRGGIFHDGEVEYLQADFIGSTCTNIINIIRNDFNN